MLIGAVVRSYGLTDYLGAVLASLSHIDKVIVFNCRFKGVMQTEDKTREIAGHYENVEVIEQHDLEQWEPFNIVIEKLKHYRAIWICDTDELLTNEVRKKLEREFVNSGKNALMLPIIDYVDRERAYKQRTHMPVVMVTPDCRAWTTRCFNYGEGLIGKELLHHMGYVGDLTWKKDNAWHSRARAEIEDMLRQEIIDYKMPEGIRRLIDENV